MTDSLHDKYDVIARRFHEVYEKLAPLYHWETQPRSRVEWADLPAEQRGLMTETVKRVLTENTLLNPSVPSFTERIVDPSGGPHIDPCGSCTDPQQCSVNRHCAYDRRKTPASSGEVSARNRDAEMLEGYAESYACMGHGATVQAWSVAWDIRHNMIPALGKVASARRDSE